LLMKHLHRNKRLSGWLLWPQSPCHTSSCRAVKHTRTSATL
jgi:hypothetical protein